MQNKQQNSSHIKISIIAPSASNKDNTNTDGISSSTTIPISNSTTTATTSDSPKMTSYLLSPNLLLSPSLDMFQFSSKLASNLSSSFNCLSASIKQSEDHLLVLRNPISLSDSNLKSSSAGTATTASSATNNIFNFGDFLLNPMDYNRHHNVSAATTPTAPRGRPPLSPYRAKSPLLSASFETPPSSPLTPIAVLHTLPAFMLTPIFQWLYSECLPFNLEEETLEKLINFAESTIPLNKMAEPCRKYLKILKLKKCKLTL